MAKVPARNEGDCCSPRLRRRLAVFAMLILVFGSLWQRTQAQETPRGIGERPNTAPGSAKPPKKGGFALEWLANHQLEDGSWSFDHRKGACQGRCGNPGSLGGQACNCATGLALLPFLGAGQTHKKGKYSKNVYRALLYLRTQQKPDGSFREPGGSMYSHGICSLALCEAYAITEDKSLQRPAQAAIDYIVMAQDRVRGGWRYSPKQPGDTSVTGWQLMALRSAQMASLKVPPQTLAGANNFLDTVQSDGGAQYGYTAPGTGDALGHRPVVPHVSRLEEG